MKKYFVAVGLLVTSVVFGQTDQGDVLIGGSLGFATGEGSSQFNLSPNIGFFVANNFAIGGKANFNSAKQGNIQTSTFGIGPFLRYYLGQAETKPFLVTEFDYLNTKIKPDSQTEIKNNGIGWLLGLGFAAFINESVAVEAVSGYNYSKFKDADGSGGFALRIGFQLYLTKSGVTSLKTNVMGN